MTEDRLTNWVETCRELCQPHRVVFCDGSEEERNRLLNQMVADGVAIPLDRAYRPHSFLFRSDPRDVARVEGATFICSSTEEEAGPTNHWADPHEMKQRLHHLFRGSMRGRTMYVVPFCMGPIFSSMAQFGVEITDSPYVVCHMHWMTRVGDEVVKALKDHPFVPCFHSLGVPLEPGQADVLWPCDPENRVIAHFPETREIWSYGSGYGGNALLGKKCLALRIASVMARDEGWLAEHMLILGITNPEGEKKYIAAAFPSQCGKTNLALCQPTLPGWKVETIGDDIAWMKPGRDGRLYAINPENGFFGVAPGTSYASNPHAMETIARNTLFTNVALTDEQNVWWEGMSDPPPHLTDWLGEPWTSDSPHPAAHPNARFTAPLAQCPVIDPLFDEPVGVPIDAILFGGRRDSVVPLVTEAFDWDHGVFFGSTISSETTAAAAGQVGKLRHDPFAMLPFCGYNMGDYFAHWLEVKKRASERVLPRIFYVNWFLKGDEGEFLWPGFGENSRVLKWIFERCQGRDHAVKTPIGWLPKRDALDIDGLTLPHVDPLLAVDRDAWLREIKEIRAYFKQFGTHLPQPLIDQVEALEERLNQL